MQKSKFKVHYGNHPFFIQGIPFLDNKTYSTHTRGLNKKGWPEFMINPGAFGPISNASRIEAAYDYLKIPRRKKILNRIMEGEIIEISINKLHKKWKTAPYRILCFRLVPNTFEAVKQAYGKDDGDVDPDLVVVQIYVKGDDFALTDEYYKDEVTW